MPVVRLVMSGARSNLKRPLSSEDEKTTGSGSGDPSDDDGSGSRSPPSTKQLKTADDTKNDAGCDVKELYQKYAGCMEHTDSFEVVEGSDILFSPTSGSGESWNPVVIRYDAYICGGATALWVFLQLIPASEFMVAPTTGIVDPKAHATPPPRSPGSDDPSPVYPYDESSKWAQNNQLPNDDDYWLDGAGPEVIRIPFGRRRITV